MRKIAAIMDNRKRQRLDVPRSANTIITVNNTTTTLNNTNAQSQQSQHVSASLLANTNTLFLDNGAELGALPANVFLTICDEDGITDDESQEYYAIDSETLAAHIKQEQHDISTQTLPPLQQIRLISTQTQQQQQHTTQTHTVLPNVPSNESPNLQLEVSPTANALLSASMQLPSGCEIYLVKEYIDGVDSNGATSMDLSDIDLLETTKCLKMETASLSIQEDASAVTGDLAAMKQQKLNIQSNEAVQSDMPAGQDMNTSATTTNTTAPQQSPPKNTDNTPSTNSPTNINANTKRQSIILDAYKKRDDKRRATHNEVERRRRDKINSWIFKLKEMLPTDMPNISNNNNNCNNSISSTNNNGTVPASTNTTTTAVTTLVANANNNTTTTNTGVIPTHIININQHNSNRTPPSDSKSQILIKACEYIKIIKQENSSLRECLKENEELRLSNQRLLSELQKLKNEQQPGNNLNVSNNNANLMNGINNSNSNNVNGKVNNNNNFDLTLSNLNSLDNTLFATSATTHATTTLTPITKSTNILINHLNLNKTKKLNSNNIGSNVNLLNAAAFNKKQKRELIIRDYVD